MTLFDDIVGVAGEVTQAIFGSEFEWIPMKAGLGVNDGRVLDFDRQAAERVRRDLAADVPLIFTGEEYRAPMDAPTIPQHADAFQVRGAHRSSELSVTIKIETAGDIQDGDILRDVAGGKFYKVDHTRRTNIGYRDLILNAVADPQVA